MEPPQRGQGQAEEPRRAWQRGQEELVPWRHGCRRRLGAAARGRHVHANVGHHKRRGRLAPLFEGVKVHRTTCPNATRLMSQYGYRIIPAQWRGDGYQKAFDTAIAVRGIDDVGIVSRITDIISKDMEVNMKSINISSNEDGTFGGKIEVMIYDLLHLEQLIAKIKATHKYIEVMRED